MPLACLTFLTLGQASGDAASLASDNAGNYDTSGTAATGFAAGSNQGTGFQPFLLAATSQAGYFVAQGSGFSQINSNGSRGNAQAFDLYGYGDPNDPNVGRSSATRPFTGALSIGQSFSISLDSRGVQANQTVGISLADASGNVRFTLDYVGNPNNNPGISDALRVTDASGSRFIDGNPNNIGFGALAGGINVVFTLTGANAYTVTATGVSDSTRISSTSGSLAGLSGSGIDRVSIFDNDAGNDNDLFFNNLAITGVPEPGSVAAMISGGLCLLVLAQRVWRVPGRRAIS